MQIKIPSILKVVSFESLAGNDFSERGTQEEAHCERNLNRQLRSIRPSPFFFRLASNAFSDIGSVGWIEKKKLKKKITRSLGIVGPGTTEDDFKS